MVFGSRGGESDEGGGKSAAIIPLKRFSGAPASEGDRPPAADPLAAMAKDVLAATVESIDAAEMARATRGELAARVSEAARRRLGARLDALNPLAQRKIVTLALNEILAEHMPAQPRPPGGGRRATEITPLLEEMIPPTREIVFATVEGDEIERSTRGELAARVEALGREALGGRHASMSAKEQRDLVTVVLNEMLARHREAKDAGEGENASRVSVEAARAKVQPALVERIDIALAIRLPRDELVRQIGDIVAEIVREERLQLNHSEQSRLISVLLDEMLGLGPIEPLLADDSITDIMVNGPKQVYVERHGKLQLTDATFRDNRHVMNVASRIVSQMGRRIDEKTPLVDARLADGSRVNIIIPPLAIDGPSISIRKFAKKKITLDVMERQHNLSSAMAQVLRIAARSRVNILISGGTGSGKTTLLNALSQMIDGGERVVTIEDAAELQLQQPHVVRLETRPANLEGDGQITMRDLLKNALRMRPDRIILGEIRGSEAVDMLQAMNTGHEGSLCTIHANRPREALTRLENMVGMAGINLAPRAVRTQIADAIDMIVQVSRMRDGIRRISHIVEVVGMEGDIVTTQELFKFVYEGEESSGRLQGRFDYSGVRPHLTEKASHFNLARALQEVLK